MISFFDWALNLFDIFLLLKYPPRHNDSSSSQHTAGISLFAVTQPATGGSDVNSPPPPPPPPFYLTITHSPWGDFPCSHTGAGSCTGGRVAARPVIKMCYRKFANCRIREIALGNMTVITVSRTDLQARSRSLISQNGKT